MPRLGDVWIPFSPNHCIRFFILRMEDLFLARDRILRVENFGMRFRLISWRAFDDKHFDIRWQMDSTNEQIFTLLPFEVVILDPIAKIIQANFISWWKCSLDEPCQFDEWWHITLIQMTSHRVQLGIVMLEDRIMKITSWFSYFKIPRILLPQGCLILIMTGWDWKHSH